MAPARRNDADCRQVLHLRVCSTSESSGLAIANVLGTGVELKVSTALIPPMDLLQRLLRV